MTDNNHGIFSFGSMTLIVGGLALLGLLAWGWVSGQSLPLWPALLVAAVNVVASVKVFRETKAKRAAMQAARPKQRRKSARKNDLR